MPKDIWLSILIWLGPSGLCSCSMISQALREYSTMDCLWRIWLTKFRRTILVEEDEVLSAKAQFVMLEDIDLREAVSWKFGIFQWVAPIIQFSRPFCRQELKVVHSACQRNPALMKALTNMVTPEYIVDSFDFYRLLANGRLPLVDCQQVDSDILKFLFDGDRDPAIRAIDLCGKTVFDIARWVDMNLAMLVDLMDSEVDTELRGLWDGLMHSVLTFEEIVLFHNSPDSY